MIKKNLYSIMVALLLLFLSLINSEKFDKVKLAGIPNIDKLVHFGMYFLLTTVIIIEHRKNIKNHISLFLLALIPLAYGVMMEILQLTLTANRSGDFYDALADGAGVLASVILWMLFKPSENEMVR
jgi:VanZ family protein